MRAERFAAMNEAEENETAWSALCVPTPNWGQRKCNVYMHLTACIIVLFVETPGCGIPLTTWLSVYFYLLVVEALLVEFKGRMYNSIYYSNHRRQRKIIGNSVTFLKEFCEAAWVIYGITLYYSDDEEGCSDQNRGFIIIMVMFLVLGVLKLVLILIAAIIVLYLTISNRLRNRNRRSASVQVLRSIQKIRYSSLAGEENNTEEECIICYREYSEEDIVTKLKCNEKHVFHTDCISEWIRQGKNSCPVCREPIDSSIELPGD